MPVSWTRGRPARQDRKADGRAGFFSARVEALSRVERMGMIEPDGPLSLSQQCVLLGVSRSSLCYRPKGESAENLALMRRIDELHMDYPFYGSRQIIRHPRREGVTAGRHRIRRLMRLMGNAGGLRAPGADRDDRAELINDPVEGSCVLLGMSRSSFYYPSKGERAEAA